LRIELSASILTFWFGYR